jgi:hypothetical protein
VAFVSTQFGLFFVFNLPPSIAAWVIGARAKGRVDRGETTEGRSEARVGMWLGIVGTVLGILALVGWALALGLSEDVRRELFRLPET